MLERTETYDVGVIVGRFQVPELHAAHVDLIESVCARHSKVIIVLGISPLHVTRQNPLDFEARKQMILERFPELTIVYNNDQPTDEAWSVNLDAVIGALVTPMQTVCLYGSRDSFITHYSGRYPTTELLQETYISGTETRNAVAAGRTASSPDFRRGVVWAAHGGFPTCFPTIDVAVLDDSYERVLLARKPQEKLFRFIGGFVDPRSSSFESDVRREVEEEAHVAITDPEYIGSFLIDDWRYRGELDVIKTAFFISKLFSGHPTPDDDIEELRWFDIPTLDPTRHIVEIHRPLAVCLLGYLERWRIKQGAAAELRKMGMGRDHIDVLLGGDYLKESEYACD